MRDDNRRKRIVQGVLFAQILSGFGFVQGGDYGGAGRVNRLAAVCPFVNRANKKERTGREG